MAATRGEKRVGCRGHKVESPTAIHGSDERQKHRDHRQVVNPDQSELNGFITLPADVAGIWRVDKVDERDDDSPSDSRQREHDRSSKDD